LYFVEYKFEDGVIDGFTECIDIGYKFDFGVGGESDLFEKFLLFEEEDLFEILRVGDGESGY
jgi:hypothetical protein